MWVFLFTVLFSRLQVYESNQLSWDNDKVKITDKLMASFSMEVGNSTSTTEKKEFPKITAFLGELLSDAAKQNYSRTITPGKIHMIFYDRSGKRTNLEITNNYNFLDQCYQIHWWSKHANVLEDCFPTNEYRWFGLGEMFSQVWPIDKASFEMQPFVTTDYLDKKDGVFGGVLEPLFVNSKGGGLYVSDVVPLYVGLNKKTGSKEKKLCIRANNPHCDSVYGDHTLHNDLTYTVCVAENIKKVHNLLSNQFIKRPQGVPDIRMITEPIWSTWAKYKRKINQEKILEFSENIKKHGFNASHIIIEDMYSTNYGTLNFDPKKFPDLAHMINRLRTDGFRVMLWITPFCNLKSRHFRGEFDCWVKLDQKVPAIIKWWNGYGAILDVTDDKCVGSFKQRLKDFQKMKLDGFKFDAGEVSALPAHYRFSTPQKNPNYFSHYYVKMASELGKLTEVRVGYKSQQYPVFVRLLDRKSDWTINGGGLHSVLTATLTLSILGYPFILPDVIGGNNYVDYPKKELYVRWLQLCVFMPSVQFSIPPWDFDTSTNNIALEALAVRKNISSYIVDLAKDAQQSGHPIIRPLWWLWPEDEQAFVIDTEFMLGDRYLVAPVLNDNVIQHVVYLPAGVWEEEWGSKRRFRVVVGERRHYIVTLRDICYFRLVEKH